MKNLITKFRSYKKEDWFFIGLGFATLLFLYFVLINS